jgi:DNA-binding transcriptional MerR regulator
VSTTAAPRALRIGELAELTGVTPRTIRYYEEIGLLPGAADRAQGKHRSYDEHDVERLREIVRLRDLLGLPLDQLTVLLKADAARAELRRAFRESRTPQERSEILTQSLGHIATQLELVRVRARELAALEQELVAKRRRVRDLLREAEAESGR